MKGEEKSISSSEAEQLTVETAIANLQQKSDLGARYYAAWWLGKFRVKEPAAIDALLMALEDESDRAPDGGYPLRRNAARALGKLGDKRAVPPLICCLEFPDFYVREASAQALETLDDTSCVPYLIQILEGGVEAAQFVPGKPHLVQPYEAVIEALGTLGATEATPLIQPFIEHPVDKVKYAAARAMYQLTQEAQYGDILIQALSGEDLQLRRSALMDLAAMGYLPAGEAIADTLAENSMKLIALKGLLETNLQANTSALSEDNIKIMDLMDSLL
ncbi:Phycocyanobilin lyase subunit alpha [Hyella patelloides LEGE 07179]|uniref:Phycocyanobilin lyase subunit alpha n=1 Tax=Hyella patelloides LEGE 07179 TaxID=945734 RepID=A0A563W0Y9_9CYAN|nr:HEAT repeat domain-containing protein [Hyella patelloides]VEP17213.1 Phycocyanobilin lyase subunit alpha [Hyella patelloides LEGE 07179]